MEEIFRRLNRVSARYILIGGQAIRFHGLPRFSMDWDLLIPAHDAENFTRINDALSEILDLPVVPLGPKGQNAVQTYQTLHGVVQFHLGVPGLIPFEEVELRAETVWIDDVRVSCISATDLLVAKEAANRPRDQDDIAFLRAKLGLSQSIGRRSTE